MGKKLLAQTHGTPPGIRSNYIERNTTNLNAGRALHKAQLVGISSKTVEGTALTGQQRSP